MSRNGSAARPLIACLGAMPFLFALAVAAPVPLGAATLQNRAPAASPAGDQALRAEIARRAGSDFREFYAARGNRPLWLDGQGRVSAAAEELLHQIETSRHDGLRTGRFNARGLASALQGARTGAAKDLAKAEIAVSKAYTGYVKALRGARRSAMIYESEALSPVIPTHTAALQSAAAARSLPQFVESMAWMHPLYAPMRRAMESGPLDPVLRQRIALNLERIRALPTNPAARYVLIDAAGARLWMYENGRPAGSMRVVVGKPEEQTPMMAGFIRYAIVNPYWNVPEDLVRSRIAYNVNAKGRGYLRSSGYEVLSGWDDDASTVDPATIDWRAVEAGAAPPRVRQRPGNANFMGKVKFMFPNAQGIYLHDTPDKALMQQEGRQFSSGCVRLEDAPRLGRWLLGKPLPTRLRAPEQRIALPEVVPVYITYLTAIPEGRRIAFRSDVYSRDDGSGTQRRLARNAW